MVYWENIQNANYNLSNLCRVYVYDKNNNRQSANNKTQHPDAISSNKQMSSFRRVDKLRKHVFYCYFGPV